MANVAIANGYILVGNKLNHGCVLDKINKLPNQASDGEFCIWKGIFYSPPEPTRAGHMITFGLSHKYFGEADEIGQFLDFWENFIHDLPADELFMAVEQEFTYSDEAFGKFYFQWKNEFISKSMDRRWVFHGRMPLDENWKSRFEVDMDGE